MKASSPILSIVLGRTTSPEILDSLNALSAILVTGTPWTEEGIIREDKVTSYPTTSYPDSVFLNKRPLIDCVGSSTTFSTFTSTISSLTEVGSTVYILLLCFSLRISFSLYSTSLSILELISSSI